MLNLKGKGEQIMQVLKKVSTIIQEAINQHYSDLFIMPKDDYYQLLYRDIKSYQKAEQISQADAEQIMSYMKYKADMSISEKRRPQNGAMAWMDEKNEVVNLRISTVGDFLDRPSMVIRFIYKISDQHAPLDVESMNIIEIAARLRGLIVFSGPMGSGKTTLIYEIAKKLSETKVVMSIEDPVEIHEDNFLQLQVNDQSGMSYQELLKSGLRNRPDIFIIGEIRDQKTAEIAVQAALSGHLVLTTIHAKNVSGVYNRIVELGVQKDHLTDALTATIYQRMVPMINLEGKILTEIKSYHPDLVFESKSWREKLNEWYRNKKITSETFQEFQYG